jgi:Tfp pilus assembly protein PilW
MTEYLVVLILGLVVLGAVAFPFLAGTARYQDPADLDADIRRYRQALAAGTLCSRCREANPQGSRYCQDCGRALA